MKQKKSNEMNVFIDCQNSIDSSEIPTEKQMENWVLKALLSINATFLEPELTIRIVSIEESRQLNLDYRGKDKPTNILSFPFEVPEMLPEGEVGDFLGDLVICEQVVIKESKEQNKPLTNHWAHLIIHGVFHLLGFDHQEKLQADEMESLEIKTLKSLGIENPYILF